jgi:hypothetical protein
MIASVNYTRYAGYFRSQAETLRGVSPFTILPTSNNERGRINRSPQACATSHSQHLLGIPHHRLGGIPDLQTDPGLRDRRADPLNRRQVGPVPLARFHRVPLADGTLEPTTPLGHIRAMHGVASTVLGLDEPEAPLGGQAEGVGIVS